MGGAAAGGRSAAVARAWASSRSMVRCFRTLVSCLAARALSARSSRCACIQWPSTRLRTAKWAVLAPFLPACDTTGSVVLAEPELDVVPGLDCDAAPPGALLERRMLRAAEPCQGGVRRWFFCRCFFFFCLAASWGCHRACRRATWGAEGPPRVPDTSRPLALLSRSACFTHSRCLASTTLGISSQLSTNEMLLGSRDGVHVALSSVLAILGKDPSLREPDMV